MFELQNWIMSLVYMKTPGPHVPIQTGVSTNSDRTIRIIKRSCTEKNIEIVLSNVPLIDCHKVNAQKEVELIKIFLKISIKLKTI